jgi:hypothetical protein
MENQEPTIQPTEPKIEAKKPLPKLPILIAAVLLILVLTLPMGGYLILNKLGIHPKPSAVTIKTTAPAVTQTLAPAIDTSTWKTYVSTAWNFSVRYPSDWKVITNEKPMIYLLPADSIEPVNGSISISLGPNDPKPQTPSWFKNASLIQANIYDKATWGTENNNTDEIAFWKNGVSVLAQPKYNSIITKNIYLKILSTFKFTL